MHERIVELLVMLMAQLQTRTHMADLDVSGLSGQGYSQSEISTAVSFLFDRYQGKPNVASAEMAGTRSIRVLHPIERSIIQPDGFGLVIQCYHFGLLTASDVESVIERIMLSGIGTAGVEEVKSAIAALLFELDRPQQGGSTSVSPTDSVH